MPIHSLTSANNPPTSRSSVSASGPDASQGGDFASQFQSLLRDGESLTRRAGDPSDDKELRKAFTDFVGQTLFGQLIASMRSTQQEPAYLHGGQAEKIFQNQFDQMLAEEMTKSSADTLADPMYELFRMRRSP
jgi:flagellar protein FlgJ